MVNISLWLGLFSAGSVMAWILSAPGTGRNIFDMHGLVIVFGGLAAAMLINTTFAQLYGAARTTFWVLFPGNRVTPAAVAAELGRLSRRPP